MRLRNLLFIGVGIIAGFAAPALADLTYTQGSGTTIFDFLCFTTKHCSAHVPINSAGVEIGTAAVPMQVSVANTGSNSTNVKVDIAGNSGSVFNANGRATSANSSPMVPPAAPTTYTLVSAATNNAQFVKASAATVFSCQLGNIDSTVAYLKIFNKASAPTVGTDSPVKTIIIPKAGTAADGAGNTVFFGPGGFSLGTGFAIAVTAGLPLLDNTAVSASKVIINCDYE